MSAEEGVVVAVGAAVGATPARQVIQVAQAAVGVGVAAHVDEVVGRRRLSGEVQRGGPRVAVDAVAVPGPHAGHVGGGSPLFQAPGEPREDVLTLAEDHVIHEVAVHPLFGAQGEMRPAPDEGRVSPGAHMAGDAQGVADHGTGHGGQAHEHRPPGELVVEPVAPVGLHALVQQDHPEAGPEAAGRVDQGQRWRGSIAEAVHVPDAGHGQEDGWARHGPLGVR